MTFGAKPEKLGAKIIFPIGFITKEMIIREIPDFKERFFYVSGPRAMVLAFEKTLKNLGAKRSQIKTDFFPGYV